MSYQNLSVTITSQQKAEIIEKIAAVKAALPFLINLTPDERQALRKVAEKRQGYVNDVMIAVKANPTMIPPVINTEEYFKDALLYNDMAEIMAHLKTLYEGINDTYMAAGNEAISVTDQCYGILKQAAKGNAALSSTVQELAKHFKSQRSKKEVSPLEN